MTTSGRYWYEFDITLANTGTTTILLQGPSGAAGVGGWLFAGVDPRYTTSLPGLTIHRLSQSSQTLATLVAASLDNTDTKPTGSAWLGAGNVAFREDQTSSLSTRYGLSGVFAGADVNDIISFGSGSGAYNYGWTLADHERHLTNYVNAMAARSMPVIFVVGHLRHTATPAMTGNPYTQSQLIAIYRKVAQYSSNAAIIDLSAQWGEGTEQERYDAMVADTSKWVVFESPRYVHPSSAGHAFFGQYVANAIMNAW
jgi:lysophospholipase L1-like esterase